MPNHWYTYQSPDKDLTLEDLAIRLSRGAITESTWVVSSETQTKVQVFDIPGLDQAARKLRKPEPSSKPQASLTVSAEQPKNCSKKSGDRRGTLAAVAKFVTNTRPNKALVLFSLCLILCGLATLRYNENELMRFPRSQDSAEVRVLPVVGDVAKTDFWIVQLCLIMASIATFELAILRGKRIRPRSDY